jgi:hypothetical protein
MYLIKKVKEQANRYEAYVCWKCGSKCNCINSVNKCINCGNLCDSSFYMDEVVRILKGEETSIKKEKRDKITAKNWFNRGYFIKKTTPPLTMKVSNVEFEKLWKEEK